MQPTLYLMLGYPGAGKTTVAKLISEITGATHLWADHERAKRFAHPTFTQDENDTLYTSMNQEASQLLASGKSVVFDTAFNHFEDREKLRDIAKQNNAITLVIWVQTNRNLAEKRAIESDGNDPHRKLDHHMTHQDFHRLSDKLEEPRSNEAVITIDGTKVTRAYIAEKIGSSQ